MAPLADDSGNHWYFWVLDTRNLWEGENITDGATQALSCISDEEAQKAKKFYFIRDAKMSVASSLLKRLFAVRAAGVNWTAVTFSRQGDPKHGKPCLADIGTSDKSPDFNVSHQAGLVVLGGCVAGDFRLGVDVVCTNERNDKRNIEREGSFEDWVDIHAEVFSKQDLAEMKKPSAPHTTDDLEGRLRRFYAFWCLKEAYIKLEGEALLAKWLKDVEFREVTIPKASESVHAEPWGEKIKGIEVWLCGRRIDNVEMVLQAFESNYMVATAIMFTSGASRLDPVYRLINLEGDVYPFVDT